MSAGICIMNRNAIAMAADSAVTVGDHAAIHNSANKLFSLSRVAPVGVIVYANAALMTVPIEIIVKQYKKQLADRVFPKLNDYVNDFLDYLRDKSQFFRFDINEQTYVLQVFSDLMRGLLGDYRIIMSSEQNNSGKPLDENGMKKVAESAVSSTITFVNGIKKRADYHFGEYIENEPRHVRFRIVYYMLGILFATGILSVSNWLIKEYRMRDTMFAHTGGELISHAGGILCNHRIVLFRQFFQLSSGALLHGLDNFRNGSCSSNFYINIERFHTKQDLLTEKCIRYTWGKSNIAASARIGNSIGIRIVFIDLRFCRSRVQVFQLNLR